MTTALGRNRRRNRPASNVLSCSRLRGSAAIASILLMPISAFAQISDLDEGGIDPLNPSNRSGFLGYSLSVSPRVTYSDNANLDTEGSESADGLATVELRGGLLVDRVNFIGLVNGRIEVGSYFDPPDVNGESIYDQAVLDQNIRAAGTVKFVENLLFLDVAAATEREALDDRSRFSTQSIAANDQQADKFSYSFSPYLFSALSNEGTVEGRYRYVNIQVDDDGAVDTIDNFLNDSESHELIAEYTSGRLLDRVSFSLRAYANQTDESGSDVLPEVDYEQVSFSGSVQYPLSRKFSVVGTVGHDDIQTNNNLFDDDDLSGVFWKAGLIATPGRRTEARLEVGERFGGTLIEGAVEYRYSSRLRFQADLSRSLNTTSQAQNTSSTILQNETLAFADELRQLQSLAAGEILDRTINFNTDLQDLTTRRSGLATSNTAGFSVLGRTKRSDFALRLAYDESDFGFQEIETTSLNGNWQRAISRQIDIYGRGSFQDTSASAAGSIVDCITALSTDPATAGLPAATITQICQNPANLASESQTLSLLGGANYQIFKEIAAFIQYSRTQRFADSSLFEFEENAITVGLTFDF